MDSLSVSLLRRSIGQKRSHQSIKPLYGHKSWATDMDIVNELGGHTGCVNALSWSKGGNLLASGSDDTYLNIWEYNPSSIALPFTLNTSVATGHRGNIFSVKFMPHSGDRTVVTCAGDSEVRVFDLEYSGTTRSDADAIGSTRNRVFNDFFPNARWMNEANTNARVYRSHSDRAKRIVTESSPHLFLTCSEDGEVRQWDLRQPSSAYPPPAGFRRLGPFRRIPHHTDTSVDLPPPLISYKKYDLDLHSITCSPSQPHYIALGGTHLHCFLHDRRMLGRDISDERGQPGGGIFTSGSQADQMMREATKCVRRFAPDGERRMRPLSTSHITACKISDARPNELIVSWSGDHIYSFDLVQSPDARDIEEQSEKTYQASQLRKRQTGKRKRTTTTGTSTSSLGEHNSTNSCLRTFADVIQEEDHTAVRVRRGNGITEDIPNGDSAETALEATEFLLPQAQVQAQRVAKALVRLRTTVFDFSATVQAEEVADMETSPELTPFTNSFTSVLGQACVLLPEMEDIMSDWPYPINPTPEDVDLQNTLRRNRQSAWRFVQAAGVLSKTLGGQLKATATAPDPRLEKFNMINPAPRERMTDESRFYYDFMKAILLWLDNGSNGVFEGFKKPANRTEIPISRFPITDEDTVDGSAEKLRAMLSTLADEEKPILDLDANRFLIDSERSVFPSQLQGVNSFIRALTSIELEMHQGLSEPGIYCAGTRRRVMDKGAAARFWGVKVSRSLLMDAAQGINYAFVQQAFGGTNLQVIPDLDSSTDSDSLLVTATEAPAAGVLQNTPGRAFGPTSPAVTAPETLGADVDNDVEIRNPPTIPAVMVEDAEDQEQPIILEEAQAESEEDDGHEDCGSDGAELSDNGNNDHDGNSTSSDDEDEEIGQIYTRSRITFHPPRRHLNINLDVPCRSHTKVYKGHCNTRTIKDVNYYGLDDEYVVSGSDDGHFFIWDRKTCQIVNILEGDGEVVNTVQGHPYEPMIACSGIDSTIKIFGAGGNSRERYRAAKGIDIANPGGSVHTSPRQGGRPRRAASQDDDEDDEEAESQEERPEAAADDDDEEQQPSRHGLRSRKALSRLYEITSRNDVDRQRGADNTFVTEDILARFAAALQRGELQGIAGQGLGGTGGIGGMIVVDQDNCSVM